VAGSPPDGGHAVIAGHYGFAAAVKAGAPVAPLWALMLATTLPDLALIPLVAAGVESIDEAAGTSGYGSTLVDAEYSHSLAGAAALAGAFGLAAAVRWGTRVGAILAAVVASHWLFDLVTHRPDLAVLPGNVGDLPLLGMGLWRVPVASGLAELALVVGGATFYWWAARRAVRSAGAATTRTADRLGALVLVAGLVTLGADVVAG